MRRTRLACCARAARGHAAAPPSSVMKSRRLTARCLPCFQQKDSTSQLRQEPVALRDFGLRYDRLGSMLLKKSFCTRDQNFFWLYTRFSCKNLGDLTA